MGNYQGESINYSILANNIDRAKITLRILTSYWPGEKLIEVGRSSKVYRFLLTRTSGHLGLKVNKLGNLIYKYLSQLSFLIWIPIFVLVFKIDVLHINPSIITYNKGKKLLAVRIEKKLPHEYKSQVPRPSHVS